MSNFQEKIGSDKIKNYFIHSSVLIDVDGASLNNWGKDGTNSQGTDNATAVKKVYKNGRWYAVVAGQAWRYWWREALGLNGWSLSPITRDEKVAYTDVNPIEFPDDDIFGYMRALNENIKDLVEEIEKELKENKKADIDKLSKEKNKVKKEELSNKLLSDVREAILQERKIVDVAKDQNIDIEIIAMIVSKNILKSSTKADDYKIDMSVTRVSPLKNSILTSITPIKLINEFSTMARQEGDAVPYEKQSYSTVLKGMFSLDLDQIGTFTKTNRSGYKNITDITFKQIIENSGSEVDDLINPNIKRARLNNEIRLQRAKDTIIALKTIAGGAKRTTNYASVKPDFIILAVLKGGNNIFDNIAVEEDGRGTLSLKALEEAIKDNREYFRSDIYIGKATGFMDEVSNASIEAIKIYGIEITVGSINTMIDEFTKVLDTVVI
jgi:CRISPR-associated protein Cst2